MATGNIGKTITDFYCNGFFGRRYDLADSVIEAEGDDWVVIRISENEVEIANLTGRNKQQLIDDWTT